MTNPTDTALKAAREHILKTWPGPFAAVRAGTKTFEYRLNDRGYDVGDVLHLSEWNPETELFTGEFEERRVSYVLQGGQFGIPDDYCIMSLDAFTEAGGGEDGCAFPEHGHWLHADDIMRMTKELDVAMNGEGGAERPLLCDIFRQLKERVAAPTPEPNPAEGEKANGWRDVIVGNSGLMRCGYCNELMMQKFIATHDCRSTQAPTSAPLTERAEVEQDGLQSLIARYRREEASMLEMQSRKDLTEYGEHSLRMTQNFLKDLAILQRASTVESANTEDAPSDQLIEAIKFWLRQSEMPHDQRCGMIEQIIGQYKAGKQAAQPTAEKAKGAQLGVPLVAEGLAPVTEGPGLGWKLSDVARDKIMELVAENVHNAGALHGIVLASLSVAQPTPGAIAERARREWEKLRPAPFYGSEFRIIEKEEAAAILQRQADGRGK